MKDNVSHPETATVTETCSVPSEMTGNDASVRNSLEQEESSIMESQKKESSEWTNEKHSLYLKSIEASFVDQLYNSLDSQKTSSSYAISSWNIPSAQFKVLQGGCWSKKSFKRENSQLKDANRPNRSTGNPWIHHFTNGSRRESKTSTAISLQYPVPESQLHQELGCSSTEVSDQNFVEETPIEKATRTKSRKRIRTCIIANLNNDQVVPFCISAASEIPDSYISTKK